VPEGPQLHALGDLHLIYPSQLEVGVDGIEQVKLILGNQGIL
jgi:hypothetical protein